MDVAIREAERIAKILEDCIATVRDDYRQGRKRNCILLAIPPSQVRQCAKPCTVDVPIGSAGRHDAFPQYGNHQDGGSRFPPISHRSLRGGWGEKIQRAVRSLD